MLVLPDRRGNHRTDTLHNVMSDPIVSLLALVPGTDQVLEVVAHSEVTTDPELLLSFAMGPNVPKTAMRLHVKRAELRSSAVLRKAGVWDVSAHLTREEAPNMMALGAAMSVNQYPRMGWLFQPIMLLMQWLTGPLFAAGYRKQLRDEGYTAPREARIVEVVQLTEDAVSLLLEDCAGVDFSFKPGQFFQVIAEVEGHRLSRSYSASSAPGPRLRLSIKRTGGAFSSGQRVRADRGCPHADRAVGDLLSGTGPHRGARVRADRSRQRHHAEVLGGSMRLDS